MANFNFEDTITLNNFDFGLSGEFTNITFSEEDVANSSYDFEFGEGKGVVYKLFTGSSNVFNSIWCDPTASLKNGRFYVTRSSDLTIIEHTKQLDYCSATKQGVLLDTLNSSDIVDISVAG